jgi:hypothetical protein
LPVFIAQVLDYSAHVAWLQPLLYEVADKHSLASVSIRIDPGTLRD